jgi:hypothetical protein
VVEAAAQLGGGVRARAGGYGSDGIRAVITAWVSGLISVVDWIEHEHSGG